MRSGASRGVSTNTTNQSVLSRPASREPLRTRVAARGEADDRQTIDARAVPADAFAGRPPGVPVGGRRALDALDALGDLAQRQLAQVVEVRVLEKVFQRPADLVGAVDLSGAQPLLQILDGQIEVDHLVGLLEEAVGHGLADGDARDALDDVLEALEVLDVEGADDVDAGVQQLEDVLVALAVAAAGNVRVRQLVDDGDGGLALEDVVEAHLLDDDAAILDAAGAGSTSSPSTSATVSSAAVRLDEADHDVDPAPSQRVRLFQHAVGLADPGREPDVQLQAAALAALDELEEVLRARSRWGGGWWRVVGHDGAEWG